MDTADMATAYVCPQKRRIIDSDVADESLQNPTEPKQRKKEVLPRHNLLSFCDELLYEIFKYLDTWSILALMNCSTRFETLLLDHRFWHDIDLSNSPLPLGILEDILGRATEKTHTIKMCGPPSVQHVAGEFKQFTCTLTTVFPKVASQLQVLELEGVSLDFDYIHISEFPASLKRLKLKDCSLKVGDQVKSIFHTVEKQLYNLEDLSIEDNNWFEPYYIMALSKLPSLRRLSLKGCELMSKFVPYGSMAARFGFSKLEELDLRFTPINNSDLQCFGAIETLKMLLLDSPPSKKSNQSPPTADATNGESKGEPIISQPECHLNDDGPSTSRAALENLRATINAQSNDCNDANQPADNAKSNRTIFKDHCYGRKSPVAKEMKTFEPEYSDASVSSSSSDDTSDDSSDDSSSAMSLPANANVDQNAQPRSSVVLIAMADAASAGRPLQAVQAPGGAVRSRAFIYVPQANNVPTAEADGERSEQVVSMLEHLSHQMRGRVPNCRGNQPANSRFLPRRDQVIYMNPQASRESPVVMVPTRRNRAQPRASFEAVMQHPMFWNILDPLDRDHTRRFLLRQLPCPPPPPSENHVSDRAIYHFGRATNPAQPEVIWIRNINRSANNRLERILLRNYQSITNRSLEHLVQCSPNLRYIDVSGTSITLAGVRSFQKIKPDCEVMAEHLNMEAAVEEEQELTKQSDNDNEQVQPAPEQGSTLEQHHATEQRPAQLPPAYEIDANGNEEPAQPAPSVDANGNNELNKQPAAPPEP